MASRERIAGIGCCSEAVAERVYDIYAFLTGAAGPDRVPNYPQGRIYPGYRGVLVREQHSGVTVLRTSIRPAKSVALSPVRPVTCPSFNVSDL
jgi:hypothetical protein